MLQKLLHPFVPHVYRSAPDVLFRAQVLSGLALTLALLSPAMIAVAILAYELPVVAEVNVLAGGLAVACLGILRRGGALALATDVLCLGVLLSVLMAAAALEGLTSPALVWLPSVPLVAVMGAGWRRGAVWTLAAVAGLVGLLALSHAGILPNEELPVDLRRITAVWNLGLFSAVVLGAAVAHEVVRIRAMSYLHDLHREAHLRHAEQSLTRQLASLGALATTLAHEAEGPLTRAMADLNALRRELASAPDLQPGVREAQLEAVEQSLAVVVRLRRGMGELQTLAPQRRSRVGTFRVSTVVEDAGTKRSGFELQLDPSLTARGDAQRVGQVLGYLFDRCARTYDYSDGPVFIVSGTDPHGVFVCAVPGRAALYKERRGERVPPNEALPDEGASFGLSLSQLLLNAMDATLEVTRYDGGALSFCVVLPAGEDDRAPLPLATSPADFTH